MLQQMMPVTEGSSPLIVDFSYSNMLLFLILNPYVCLLNRCALNRVLCIQTDPLDCSSLKSLCNLAWLVRDNPSYLNGTQGIVGAKCTNGTKLLDLSAIALRHPICL